MPLNSTVQLGAEKQFQRSMWGQTWKSLQQKRKKGRGREGEEEEEDEGGDTK